MGSPEMGVYAASKAAVHALSEGLRREVAGDGVRVAVVVQVVAAPPDVSHVEVALTSTVQAAERG